MMYLVLTEVNQSLLPKDPEERKKLTAPVMEMVKKDLDSGELKIFGMSLDGIKAFTVSTQDEKTIFTKAQMLAPYWKFKVMPMLSFDEVMDAMKAMQQ